MSYLIAAYAITLGALVFYGISLARELGRSRSESGDPDGG